MMAICARTDLEKFAAEIFQAVGTPDDLAEEVAASLVLSNLLGHDSHGVLRIPSYLEHVDKGIIVPSARPVLVLDTATTATVDGQWAFGQVTAHMATEVAINKAREHRVAAVALTRCNHIGRLGEYTEMAARAGMVGIMIGATHGADSVAPYGGAARALSTNPISFSVPSSEEPVVADLATSAAAEGKLRLARANGQQLPPGILLDKRGCPSTDPDDYYAGGMLLPAGGHKGYVLGVLADLIGKYLAGADDYFTGNITWANVLIVIKIEAFRPLREFTKRVDTRTREIKATPPAPGFEEVMLPGEPELRTLRERTERGIPIPEGTVTALSEVARRLNVAIPESLRR